MKAVIPVAGAGVNLRPHTYTQPKPLIPVAGKPIISFIIDQLKDAGINELNLYLCWGNWETKSKNILRGLIQILRRHTYIRSTAEV